MESNTLFVELNADNENQKPTEIESLCMNCFKTGITRMLLTKIPYYKDVVIMSFTCEECGFQNNEIQSGGAVSEKGVRITLSVENERDLNRQVVKSDYCSVKIVELNFEIPSKSQKGEITTVEGIISRSILGLEQDQAIRKVEHPELAEQIERFLNSLKQLKELKQPFTLILEDISGNSFIENPNAPLTDSNCSINYFVRNLEQQHTLGIYDENTSDGLLYPIKEGECSLEDMESEILQFPTNCPNCNVPCETNMKLTKIPHFKEVVIMATVCENCGIRTNEVKSAGGIEPKGIIIEVDVKSKEDFSRDVLNSETCSLRIPELDLEVGSRALGGRFTTIEGLLVAMKEQLSDPNHCFMYGDSQNLESKLKFKMFLKKIDEILEGNLQVKIILDDPTGNSYIQSLNDDGLDEGLKITYYDRTYEQNEDLGLNDIKTENYES